MRGMVAGIDRAAAVHLCTDGPVLLEVGVVADDGRRVGAFFLPDFVGFAVTAERAELVCTGVVGRVVLTQCERTHC